LGQWAVGWSAACVVSSCCIIEGAEAIHVLFHVAPLGLAKRLCGLDKALSARWPPSTDVETVG